MDRARLASDSELRRLVKEAQFHRWLLPLLLERAERLPIDPQDQFMRLARFFVHGEGTVDGHNFVSNEGS